MRATRQALEEVHANRDAWDARLQERLVVLAAAIAQRVVERTREQDPDVFVELAQRAVAAFPVEEAVRIRLHPTDQAVLADARHLDQVVGDRTVRWVPDEDVMPGGCIVEGPDRIVDGRVDEVLCRIVRTLIDG
jgi:flagellar assembly protein FliH